MRSAGEPGPELKGLTDALGEARFRGFAGPPRAAAVLGEGGPRVIRRYYRGRESPPRSGPSA